MEFSGGNERFIQTKNADELKKAPLKDELPLHFSTAMAECLHAALMLWAPFAFITASMEQTLMHYFLSNVID